MAEAYATHVEVHSKDVKHDKPHAAVAAENATIFTRNFNFSPLRYQQQNATSQSVRQGREIWAHPNLCKVGGYSKLELVDEQMNSVSTVSQTHRGKFHDTHPPTFALGRHRPLEKKKVKMTAVVTST
jgi:hypothetical protein